MKTNRYWKPNLPEIHIAVIGANGSGKSALTVKYITKRFIGEYDPNLEDTYCKRDVIGEREYMVWVMDTVEATNKDANRYLGWADIFIVVYSITDNLTFDFAEKLLSKIKNHEHSACRREHSVVLVANKCDMERYRLVSKTQGSQLAADFCAEFFETNCTEEYAQVRPVFHKSIELSHAQRRSCPGSITSSLNGYSRSSSEIAATKVTQKPPINPNGVTSSSDSEKSLQQSPSRFQCRSRTKSPNDSSKSSSHEKSNSLPNPKKTSQGLKWFKLFQS